MLGLALLLVLALVACAKTPEPTLPVAATAFPVSATDSARTPTSPAADTHPTAPSPPSSPPPSSAESPWPTFLRELDFAIAAGNSYGPRALAVHPELDRIYARTRAQDNDAPGRVTVLDRTNRRVLAIAETGLDDYGEGALAVDTNRNRLYAINTGDATCSVLDATSLNPVTTLRGVAQLALDEEGGRVYVAGHASLRVLDAAGYTVLQQASVTYASKFLDLEADPSEGRVYLAYQDSAGYTLGQYDATTLQELTATDLPGRPDSIVADPNRDRVYVTLNDGEQNLLWILEGDGRLLEERILGEWTQKTHLALDPSSDRLFLGREVYRNQGITILSLQSGQEIGDFALDLAPNALTWDPEAGQLLVSHTYADRISLVEVETGETIAMFPTARNLVDLAVDPERGYLYLTDTAGQLHVLDSETDEELNALPAEGFIAVDSPHGRLYTGGEGTERVRVFDADTSQQTGEIRTRAKPVADAYHGDLYLVQGGIYLTSLETMTITATISDTLPQQPGYSPNPAAIDAVVDPGSGRVFAIINNGVPGSNNGNYLYVYEPETYEKVLTDTERSPVFLDVDPSTGRAYVSRIHLAGRSTSLLADGREYTARLEAVFGALRVDPTLDRLYLVVSGLDEGYLLILDAENLDLLGSVPVPGRFTLRALDPQRHLLYLATQEGQVQIWSATGGELAMRAEPTTARPPAGDIYRLFRGPGDTPFFTGSLYRSDDGGESWQRINNGLPQRGVQEVVVSPDFAQDETLFAALSATDEGLGIWKSTDGGLSWRMANRGLTDLAVNDLAVSPNFAVDQTLYATSRRHGLFRSIDGGETWERLTDRYDISDTYPQPPGSVFVSPTYAKDQTVFVAHEGLQRSIDGGETWGLVFPEMSSLAFSPGFATDHILFGWSGSGGVLRSTDSGDTWQAANAGLVLTSFGSGRVIVSPDFSTSQTLYFIWTPSPPDVPVRFFRSTDAARTWQHLAGEPPQAATPAELSADGTAFLALDDGGRSIRWPVHELDWQAVALPPLDEIEIDALVLSPNFLQDQILFALSTGAGILRSGDAGLTWSDTGFPVRAPYAMPLKLVILTPETLMVGTPLGLYRFGPDGVWTLVEGGLPQGINTTSPELGPDDSLRVLVSGRGKGDSQRVFLSTDSGQTWTQPIPSLPLEVITEDLLFSPAFTADHTAFIALSWDRPRRTTGDQWQEIGPPGAWNLSTMHLSPAFHQDQLLFMRLQDNSLWRSSDGGDRWTDVSGPWGGEAPLGVTSETGYTLEALTFSPAFAQDGVILTRAGNALYRTEDQGATWAKVLDLGLLSVQAAFTPGYPVDGTIMLLQGHTLFRSSDRGQRWQALPPAPWDELDEVTLLLSPTFARDSTLLVWTRAGRIYQSRDGGQSWHDVSQGLPPVSIRQVLFSPGHAADGLIYLIPHGLGLYKRVGDSPWTAATDIMPSPTPAPLPSPKAAPLACAMEPVHFLSAWQQVRARLGCPEQPAEPVTMAEQSFEHGRMLWTSSNLQVYVLLESGTWQAFEDTFAEGVDPAYDPALPPPPQQPQRGFGKVWRQHLGGPQAAIGWALEHERPVSGWWQRFDHGLLVWTDAIPTGAKGPGTAYLLYDDGMWEAISTPAP